MIRVHKPISNYCPLGQWECEKMCGIRNWLWSSRVKSWMASKSKRAQRGEWKSKTEIRYECEKKASERKLESRSSCTDTRASNTHTFSIFASAISFLFDSARRNQLIAISCTPFSNFIRTNIVCSSSLQSQFTYLFVWHFYLHLVLVFRWHLICHSLNGLSVSWRIKLHQLPEHIHPQPHIYTNAYTRVIVFGLLVSGENTQNTEDSTRNEIGARSCLCVWMWGLGIADCGMSLIWMAEYISVTLLKTVESWIFVCSLSLTRCITST